MMLCIRFSQSALLDGHRYYELTWTNMLASGHLRRIVSGLLSRSMMGISISSAELSKNDITELSAVRKMETCSTATPKPFDAKAECFSMNCILSSFGPPWYRCKVRTCDTGAVVERVRCLVANSLIGSLESAEVGNWPPGVLCDASRVDLDSSDFMDVPRSFFGFLILLGLRASIPVLSKSEESESRSNLEETWMSFWSGSTTGHCQQKIHHCNIFGAQRILCCKVITSQETQR